MRYTDDRSFALSQSYLGVPSSLRSYRLGPAIGRVGRYFSGEDLSRLGYLATLSYKYDLDLEKLIQNILAASKRGESALGEFKISRRHRGDGREIFLLTRNASIIAQVCLPDRTMQQIQDETKLKVNLSSLKPRRLRKISSINPTQEVRIGDLKPGMNRINLKAKVLEVSSPRHVFSKLGVPLIVSTAVISDGTGKIKMSLWNDQVNAIGVGDVIQIENGQVKKYNGEPQIAVTRRYGKLGVISKAVNGRQTLTSKPTIMASQS